MAKITIETTDEVAAQAIDALCHSVNYVVPEGLTDQEIADAKKVVATDKLLDMIGGAIQAHKQVQMEAAIAAARSGMKQVTTVTVE